MKRTALIARRALDTRVHAGVGDSETGRRGQQVGWKQVDLRQHVTAQNAAAARIVLDWVTTLLDQHIANPPPIDEASHDADAENHDQGDDTGHDDDTVVP